MLDKSAEVLARILLMWGCCGVLGCASGPEAATYGRENGRAWVSGPWEAVKPSSDVDEVIDQLCPAVMKLPLAQEEDHGREYCGVIYTVGDGIFYASYPSFLGDTRAGRVSPSKTCYIPRTVRDTRGQSVPLGDYHSHPWSPSPMTKSVRDRVSATQIYSFRIQFDNACHLQKLVPHLDENRPGELYERRGKHWKLIGFIKPEDKDSGFITLINE
jgi:hypothetical protein